MGKLHRQLDEWERTRVMVMRAEGSSVRAIARTLLRSASTISRELRRNGHKGSYCAHLADVRARQRRRVRRRRLWCNERLLAYVAGRMRQGWSPERIAGRLGRMFGKDSDNCLSHETIYASIYAMPRGELRKQLIRALKCSHKTRRPRSRGKDRRGRIPDLRPISERPQEVQDRQMPGHWEGDLIKGKGNKSAIGTLVERTSRYLVMVQLPDATAPVVAGGFVREMKPMPPHLRRTLTYDRGREMARHAQLAQSLQLEVYFADPYAPWQRGTNESTNGIIRRWLPKGCDLSPYSQEQLNAIADNINNIPRKCLAFLKPKEVFRKIAKDSNMTLSVAIRC